MMELTEARYRRARQGNSWHCAECAAEHKLCDAHRRPTEFDLGEMISRMREECPEWRDLSTWTPRRVATSFCAAWQGFLRRAKNGDGASSGYPRYKSRRHALAVPHRCLSGCKITKSDRRERDFIVRLAGIGDVHARNQVPAHVNAFNDADVRFLNDHWEISVAVEIEPRRESWPVRKPMTIEFDLIEGFARVNGVLETPPGLIAAQALDDRRQSLQADFDLKWPRGKRLTDDERQERSDDWRAVSRLAARIARVRSNALHVWSKRLVERASVLSVKKPPMRAATATPRGDEKQWGAAVKTVSSLNRNALSYAPAMAVQMIEYKAKELGISVQVTEDKAPEIAIGEKLVAAGKAVRKSKRAIRNNDNEHDQQGTRSPRRSD